LWIFQKAGNCRNVEAMIKLAVAYLYCEGVPECAGKGTLDSVNGARATEWLQKAERVSRDVQPFSWVLIRPPWAPHGICCKACVHFKFKELADSRTDCSARYAYLVGKTLSFHEVSLYILQNT
jgi:F-box protein 1 (cyclin F)